MKDRDKVLIGAGLLSVLCLAGVIIYSNSQKVLSPDLLPQGGMPTMTGPALIGTATAMPEVRVVEVMPPSQNTEVVGEGKPCWHSSWEINRSIGPAKHDAITGNGWKCKDGGWVVSKGSDIIDKKNLRRGMDGVLEKEVVVVNDENGNQVETRVTEYDGSVFVIR